jgi:hypothetical protein
MRRDGQHVFVEAEVPTTAPVFRSHTLGSSAKTPMTVKCMCLFLSHTHHERERETLCVCVCVRVCVAQA